MSSLTHEQHKALGDVCKGMDVHQLREAVSEMRHWLDGAERMERLEFHAGDLVTFETAERGKFKGTVVRLLEKNVLVELLEAPPYQRWTAGTKVRVTPSLLTKVEA